jgi:hypothetical protein
MAEKSITSANSKFTLTVIGFGLGPHVVQGYSADAAFLFDAVDVAETVMGVDGKMSGGYIPHISPQTITLQADSDSLSIFEAWDGAQKAAKELAYATAVIDIAAIGRSFILTRGALKRVTPVPEAAKTLRPVVYAIDWGDVQPTPLLGVGG